MKVEGLPLGKVLLIQLAKGATTSVTVPAGHIYYLSYGTGVYTADATAATRLMTVYINDGTVEHWFMNFTATASTTLRQSIGLQPPTLGSLYTGGGLPGPVPIPAGYAISVGITTGQAGDTWKCDLVVFDVVVGS